MTYEEALAYLEDTSSFGIKPGLERIQALMQALGNPERDYKIIHVTGTNGKGSVTTYISYALFTSGLRVGRFTSPHLESYTERIEINDVQISKDAFGELISRVRQGLEQIIADGVEAPTQFEILTAAAFLFFKEQGVDYAVIEAGLGGLLDSTNIVKPIVSVITNVTLDHQAYCGDTVEEIAKHKAGIIKEGVPIVTAAQGGPLGVIEEAAKDKHAPLYIFNRKFGIDSRSVVPGGQIMTISAVDMAPAMLFTTMAGVHQSVNLACALQAVRLVMEQDDAISEETMREGFARATWAGRFEIKKALDRTFIFDGAHNAAGAESFNMTYQELFEDKPKTIVMAILSDKDENGIIREVVKPKDTVIAVAAPTPRTEIPEQLVENVRQCVKQVVAQTEESVSDALELALRSTQAGDNIVVCGSLYILGEARAWLQDRLSH
ncbi:bifunctional folylpolyglutamate synthase/dihydrofolate synthase [Veillonella tobetsuensis]|uniref:tetrahydrofolate synthase n=1 Tax=Veillonella tobetsuensis TaxID=1110546 RepID=A0A2S7ZP84_9FIRM|nr:folylpolyglutamate synthase/dihydrofolate synthase family protein [Veillonella tobetsuensis]PQL25066.1 bifunctional folylpolyglutamate synthase/dihydrofolate synthase [Veillonella tobetsuensis]